MGHPAISVIVTNYNYGHFLGECVASIRNQTFKDFELIIVDDASTDGSRTQVQELADIAILFSKNQGTMVASNAGVSLARGTYCVLVNADDRIDPAFLASTHATMVADPTVAFTYTDFWHFGTQPNGQVLNHGVYFPEWSIEALRQFNYILCSALFKREVFQVVGGFQVDYGMEDYDLWLRMGGAGYNGKRTAGYLYHYRAHNSNRTLAMNVHEAMEKIKRRNGVHPSQKVAETPIFSLCYATKRVGCMETIVNLWLDSAAHRERVEVLVGVDSDDALGMVKAQTLYGDRCVVQGRPPFNAVKAWNALAKKSSGKVIIAISDDFTPPKHWDTQLLGVTQPGWIDEEWVVKVNDCNNSAPYKAFTLPILTRKRYMKLGYLFYPEYESMFCDREFDEHAKQDGVILDARTLMFEHCHYTCLKRPMDDVDKVHASKLRWNQGEAVFKRRFRDGFDRPGPIATEIVELWRDYVTSVREPVFTVSLEASLWLEDYLKNWQGNTVLDMGANFESVVFAKAGLAVTVADMDDATIGPTVAFMTRYSLMGLACPIGQLDPTRKFNIVFVNAGAAESTERFEFITQLAPRLLQEGGVIILNDGHFMNVRRAMDSLTAAGWSATVPNQTMDRYDRYWVVLQQIRS